MFRFTDQRACSEPGAEKLILRGLLVVAAFVIDLLTILLAWVVGYVLPSSLLAI
ncbi:MAG: hypothetical protein LRY63_09730 [Nitrincola sp.]|nr:hypothetical protein [Nitrincola sp.]